MIHRRESPMSVHRIAGLASWTMPGSRKPPCKASLEAHYGQKSYRVVVGRSLDERAALSFDGNVRTYV